MTPATMAAAAPTRSEPRLVVNRFWAISTTSSSSLFRHHDHAGIDAVWITTDGSVAAHRVDVPNKVSDDQARIVVRNRIVAVPRTRVVEAATLPVPACDVEVAEADDWHRAGCSVDVRKGAVRRQIGVQDSAITRWEAVLPSRIGGSGRIVRVEHRPVVVAVLP